MHSVIRDATTHKWSLADHRSRPRTPTDQTDPRPSTRDTVSTRNPRADPKQTTRGDGLSQRTSRSPQRISSPSGPSGGARHKCGADRATRFLTGGGVWKQRATAGRKFGAFRDSMRCGGTEIALRTMYAWDLVVSLRDCGSLHFYVAHTPSGCEAGAPSVRCIMTACILFLKVRHENSFSPPSGLAIVGGFHRRFPGDSLLHAPHQRPLFRSGAREQSINFARRGTPRLHPPTGQQDRGPLGFRTLDHERRR